MLETLPTAVDTSAVTEVLIYILLLVYIVFSAILIYHWKNYGTDLRVYRVTSIIYFGSTTLLFLVMFISRLFI
jgi:hypothetical protein